MNFRHSSLVLLLVFLLALLSPGSVLGQESESKEQHDARMAWWRDAKFGMFIHWGLYAELAGEWNGKQVGGIGEWILMDAQIPVADYKKLDATFNPIKFNADEWVATAKAAGMKYIVITAKHHDGFAMFKSAYPFNIVDSTPFKRDPLMELAKACKKQNIRLGFYYSQDQDWTAEGGGAMRGHWDRAQDGDFAQYFRSKALPQVKELLANYPDAPAVLWFDTPSKNMTPELVAEMLDILKAHPKLIWNNRLGGGNKGDTETPEQHIPPMGYPGRDWETCMTINNTWGFKKNDLNWKSTETLLRNLIDIVSKGGNYLLNVGPDAEGVIPSPEVERLAEIGKWLKVNGEAIYATHASPFPKGLPWGRATTKANRLYLHVFDWPKNGKLIVPVKGKARNAWLLSKQDKLLPMTSGESGLKLTVPTEAPDPLATVIAVEFDGPMDPLPPAPLAQKDGIFKLDAMDAALLGAAGSEVKIQLEQRGGQPNIGYWTKASDYVEWDIKVEKPGDYLVALEYAKEGGSPAPMILMAGAETLKAELASTGGWDKFGKKEAGKISVPKAGVVKVKLQPGVDGNSVNLRSIQLKAAE